MGILSYAFPPGDLLAGWNARIAALATEAERRVGKPTITESGFRTLREHNAGFAVNAVAAGDGGRQILLGGEGGELVAVDSAFRQLWKTVLKGKVNLRTCGNKYYIRLSMLHILQDVGTFAGTVRDGMRAQTEYG